MGKTRKPCGPTPPAANSGLKMALVSVGVSWSMIATAAACWYWWLRGVARIRWAPSACQVASAASILATPAGSA